MKELLPFFKNPSHYLGTELNSVYKDKEKVRLRWALAFPDVYPVAISYTGQHILYHILNSHPHIWAERVYAPSPEVGMLLKQRGISLATLESDTSLKDVDVVGFSLTHELSYTTVVYMLDLAGIPFFSIDRKEEDPILIAGGEAVYNPEPIKNIFDVFVIGDGEEVIQEISQILLGGCSEKKEILLKEIAQIEGTLVPCFYRKGKKIKKRLYFHFQKEHYPIKQIVPFGRPVHDRYTIEISKGCTRGCRFCYAGMVNRPVRERSLDQIKEIMRKGLEDTGYGELGFLSLSTGDFSSLRELFSSVFSYCFSKQISISLPSLRAGSVERNILKVLSQLKKTGLTIAPEAGTQRLRDVINKGITEEDILQHAKWAFDNGWDHIKLYFMIGLPTETEEDLKGIWQLSKRILSLAPNKRRTKISVSISPFVPKPHTPFQWEVQSSLEETRDKINYLRRLFKGDRRLRLSWPILEMSIVEGVFSRGDQNLTRAIIEAYRKGDVFTSWRDFFDFSIWQSVFESLEIDYLSYLKKRDVNATLPWDYIDTGVSKKFLLKERAKAYSLDLTEDCRWGKCEGCGVCDFKRVYPLVNDPERGERDLISLRREESFFIKKFLYRIWFRKIDMARYLSQIELQSVLERILRRARIPVSFSGGFHPRPRISFGRALPVGVTSLHEWFLIYTRKPISEDIISFLNENSIRGIEFFSVEKALASSPKEAMLELFVVKFRGPDASSYLNRLMEIKNTCFFIQKKGKEVPARDIVAEVHQMDSIQAAILFSWKNHYINPLMIIQQICKIENIGEIDLTKRRQFFDEQEWRGWVKDEIPGYREGM